MGQIGTLRCPEPPADREGGLAYDEFGRYQRWHKGYLIISCPGWPLSSTPGPPHFGILFWYAPDPNKFGFGAPEFTLEAPQNSLSFGDWFGVNGDFLIVECLLRLPSPDNPSNFYNEKQLLWYKLDNSGKPSFWRGVSLPLTKPSSHDARKYVLVSDRLIVHDTDYKETGCVFVLDIQPTSREFGKIITRIDNPTPNKGDTFGSAIEANADHLFIGAANDYTTAEGAGAVYVYSLREVINGGAVIKPARLYGGSDKFFRFGTAGRVGASHTHLFIGASSEVAIPKPPGVVYGYNLKSSQNSDPEFEVESRDPHPGGRFGKKVVVAENRLFILQEKRPLDENSNGVVYVFDCDMRSGTYLGLLDELEPPARVMQNAKHNILTICASTDVISVVQWFYSGRGGPSLRPGCGLYARI